MLEVWDEERNFLYGYPFRFVYLLFINLFWQFLYESARYFHKVRDNRQYILVWYILSYCGCKFTNLHHIFKLPGNSEICNRHSLEYVGLKGWTIGINVAQNAIFSKIRRFDISQINLVKLIFVIVQEIKISCYSLKRLTEIIGLYKKKMYVYN